MSGVGREAGAGATPGPWRFLEEGCTESIHNRCEPLTICADDDLAIVFSADDSTVKTTRAQAIANARLIASAPDLLEALQLLVSHAPYWISKAGEQQIDRDALAVARAAIARATGERK